MKRNVISSYVAEDAVEFVIVPATVVVKGAHLGELNHKNK